MLERIDDGDAAPSEAVLQILAQQQAATVLRSHREDQAVPDLYAVITGQVDGGLEARPGRIGHLVGIGPVEQGGASRFRIALEFSGQDPVQLTQCLGGNHHLARREGSDQHPGRSATRSVPGAFRIGEDVGLGSVGVTGIAISSKSEVTTKVP